MTVEPMRISLLLVLGFGFWVLGTHNDDIVGKLCRGKRLT